MNSDTHAAPWRRLYAPMVDPDLGAPDTSTLQMFLGTVATSPHAPAIHYFGNTISRADLAQLSRKIATVLAREGVKRRDRVAVSLQNTPLFPAVLLAVWGLGATAVPLNPMVRPDELAPMLHDSDAHLIIAHPDMTEVINAVRTRVDTPPTALWTSPRDLAGGTALPFGDHVAIAEGERSLLDECARVADDDFTWRMPDTDDVALLTYTSGTTGPSKGAMSTHANLAYQAVSSAQWFACDDTCSVLTIAPLFHITGLGLHAALALGNGYPMVMTYRFEPATVLALIEAYAPTLTIGAITAFISLLDYSPDSGRVLSLLANVFSGGAAVPAHVVERYERASSRYIHNIYGLTETTSACIAVPIGTRAPIEKHSGALSVGLPMGGTVVTIVDEAGNVAPPDVEGEIVVTGPQVGVGYWHRPDETARTFRPDGVHTGDIGVMDANGWVYVVDRKKDLVVVSGYKVWPREVEDVLYRHNAVQEAAVVGQPDSYRGETLHAFISVRRGESVTVDELRSWCRERLSAYKVPTHYSFVDELPKTLSGKVLRRSLRA